MPNVLVPTRACSRTPAASEAICSGSVSPTLARPSVSRKQRASVASAALGAMARQPVSQPSCSAVLPRAWTALSSARRRALTSRVAGAPACSTSMCSSKITAATRSVSSSRSSTASAARRAVSIFAPLMEPLRSSTSPIASGGRGVAVSDGLTRTRKSMWRKLPRPISRRSARHVERDLGRSPPELLPFT